MIKADTIIALSTPTGVGALAMIRVSGEKTFEFVNGVLKGKDLAEASSHTLQFKKIVNGETLIDEVVLGIYKGPNSYTGEDICEISCHGSSFIIQSILDLLIEKGCRLAEPGEFTLRAYLNGKLDLSQAEAVADLIASENASMHRVAVQQLRGGFSSELKIIRTKLLDFASLLELELDFSEEDLEFVNREQLKEILEHLINQIQPLIDSFALGNALKKGVPLVIAGKPNAGKSTLLNALIKEQRAIVSSFPGTTRDTIEVAFQLEGILFRIIDTAGIRESTDEIEKMGIQKTYDEIEKAGILLYLFDLLEWDPENLLKEIEQIRLRSLVNIPQMENVMNLTDISAPTKMLILGTKSDLVNKDVLESIQKKFPGAIFISAKKNQNLDILKQALVKTMDKNRLNSGSTIVTNSRHVDALKKTLASVQSTLELCNNPNSGELLAFEIRQALYWLGTITGEVSNDELLGNIFSKFCIGK